MRIPNDERLLSSDADIDLILGGHDHHYEVRQVCSCIMVEHFNVLKLGSYTYCSFKKHIYSFYHS